MAKVFERISRLKPSQLRTVAERRYADAECLLRARNNERLNGAMYLGGFVLECLLKARLLETYPWLQSRPPDNRSYERTLWSLCYRSHDLDEIPARLPGVTRDWLDRYPDGRERLLILQRLCSEWT